MRNALGVAIAALFLGTVPASAQMRRAPVVRVTRLPNRVATYRGIRQARPPVRFVNTVHPVVLSFPQRPVGRAPNPTLVPTATQAATVEPSNLAFTTLGGTPIPLGQLLNPTPGLGFDYNHLAAVNSDLGVRAFIDPVTEHELAIAESLPEQAPVGADYFPTFAYGGAIPSVSPSQPQVIVVQQPVPQPAAAPAPAPMPTPAKAAPAPPPLPVGELYLVRRDGSVIRAIAFSEQNGQVIYITKDGLRRSMPLGKLNIQATQQRNAEHGTIVHLSK